MYLKYSLVSLHAFRTYDEGFFFFFFFLKKKTLFFFYIYNFYFENLIY